ncbi:MAG: UvrD-helicase domain-containing protein [bacterium]
MIARYPRPAALAEIPLDRHAVVEASAGTGKTYTIEHLVVDRLLRAGVTLEALLVVTFTDKATTELRARIRALIEAVLAAPVDPAIDPVGFDPAAAEVGEPDVWFIDGARRQALEEALFAFDRAPIHTIHAWCRRVLIDMAFDSGQLFEQDRVDGQVAFKRAWRVTLRHELAREPAPRARLERWLRAGRDEGELERLLWAAHQKRYLDAREPVEEELGPLMAAFAADFDPGAVLADLLGVAIQQRSLDAAEAVLGRISDVLAGTPDAEERLEALVRLDLDALLAPKRTAVGKQKRRFPDELWPQTRATIDRLGRLRVLRGLLRSMEREVVEAFLPPVATRLDVGKRRAGQFDYDDLLDRVWRALEGPDGEALAESLRARYRYGIIDEFQDTDARQWAIFRRVFVDGSDGILYVIGDPKQAIYGFRGADVHTYLEARAALLASATGASDGSSGIDGTHAIDRRRPAARVALRTNFRSSAALIAGLNRVLDQEGRHPLFSGAIRYDEPVECGRAGLQLVDAAGREVAPVVLLHHLPPRPRRRGERELSGWQLMQAFAHGLADHLQRMLADEAGALTLVDGKPRPLRARDVYCLVRTGREARELERALRQRGLGCVIHQQEGLFATREALDVRDVLAAVVAPHGRAARLKAFATPFFGVEWAVISGYRALPGDHPFIARLFEWHRMAEQGRYAALFHAMLHDSGLVQRQLFLSEDERRLTNYRHILEILLEECTRRRLTVTEAVALLDAWVAGTAQPEGAAAQRLADEGDAVQIMTIHKSKGLEAAVVCLFGFFLESRPDPVQVVHDGEGRRVLVGEEARDAAAALWAREAAEEDQRLLYVALTRARVRLVLPFVDSSRAIKGGYEALNRRLWAMSEGDELEPAIFAREEVAERGPRRRSIEPIDLPGEPLSAWTPPAPLLSAEPPADPMDFEALRARHAPLVVTSYTRLKAEQAPALAPVEADEFKIDLGVETAPAQPDEEALPGGRFVGRFLHEVIERLPFEAFAGNDFEAWARDPAVEEAFDWSMRRHEIDERWRAVSRRIVWATLTRPVAIDEGRVIDGLWQVREQREMEFLYPIPERHHPLLAGGGGGPDALWSVERGFIKGFVDLVFEHEGRVFWADWKSDILPSYDIEALERHIGHHYDLQAQLYTLSMVRLLGIRDEDGYDASFGGLLYVFLRGFAAEGPAGTGVYFARPSWEEVIGYEESLRLGVFDGSGR